MEKSWIERFDGMIASAGFEDEVLKKKEIWLSFISQVEQEAVQRTREEIAQKLSEKYAPDGGPALVVFESYEDEVEQRPALQEVLALIAPQK